MIQPPTILWDDDIFRLLREGCSIPEIADRYGVVPEAMQLYIEHIVDITPPDLRT